MKIHPKLIRAYRKTNYVAFHSPEHLSLQIGLVSHPLKRIMLQKKVTTAAFLTSCNPCSIQQSIQDNSHSLELLENDLKELNLEYSQGEGTDPSGLWPAEESFLIFGISLHQAEILADKYVQNGFVWIGSQDGLVTLKLQGNIEIPTQEEILDWKENISAAYHESLKTLNAEDIAWLMSVPEEQLVHWLDPQSWDLNSPWPIALPNGSAMGIGTELDRMFRLIAAGVQKLN